MTRLSRQQKSLSDYTLRSSQHQDFHHYFPPKNQSDTNKSKMPKPPWLYMLSHHIWLPPSWEPYLSCPSEGFQRYYSAGPQRFMSSVSIQQQWVRIYQIQSIQLASEQQARRRVLHCATAGESEHVAAMITAHTLWNTCSYRPGSRCYTALLSAQTL